MWEWRWGGCWHSGTWGMGIGRVMVWHVEMGEGDGVACGDGGG